MLKNKRVLLVGAHPNNAEIICGGTISKYKGKTAQVKSVIFAPCLEDPLNEGILEEYKASMKMLGVEEAIAHDYPRAILEDHIQDVRDLLHELKETFDPEFVFCSSINDLHQDHRAVASACKTIFRDNVTVLSGEIMRSTVHFKPNLYVSISYEDMVGKFRLFNVYKTQTRRTYFTPEIVEAIARYRGCQAFTLYAEAFEIGRMIDR